MANTYKYYCNCVNWPRYDVHREGGLSDMINDGVHITRRTFLTHVDREDLRRLEDELGYDTHPSRGLTMAGDWHVSYHRSKLHGKTVYYFAHSAIEFVFKLKENKRDKQDKRHHLASVVGETDQGR